jgi:predicted hydrocarbon binding protein
MHAVVHLELKQYVEARHGAATWRGIFARSAVPLSTGVGPYRDEEVRAVIEALAERTRTSPEAVLEDFGRFLAPALIGLYPNLIPREWRTLDVLEHAEEAIHRVVRAQSPAAHPPALQCRRLADNEAVILYSSSRKLCALAKGIIVGVASHYGEQVNLVETSCMHRGDLSCRLVIRLDDTETKAMDAPVGSTTR